MGVLLRRLGMVCVRNIGCEQRSSPVRSASRVAILPGADTRGHNGYVLVHPSKTQKGSYEWLDDVDGYLDGSFELATAPAWLVEALQARETRASADSQSKGHDVLTAALTGPARGTRNDTLFRAACSLRARDLPYAAAQVLINKAAHECNLPCYEGSKILRNVYSRYQPSEASRYASSQLEEEVGGQYINLAEVEHSNVRWLWQPYIPLGLITLLAGPGGLGKSSLALALAADVSRGRALPQSHHGLEAPVLIFNGEDDIEDVIVPRLIAQGADLSKIHAYRLPKEGLTLGPGVLTRMAEGVKQYQPALLIIDPVVYFSGPGLDLATANHVRSLLSGVMAIAGKDCAVLMVHHHNPFPKEFRFIHQIPDTRVGEGAALDPALSLVADEDVYCLYYTSPDGGLSIDCRLGGTSRTVFRRLNKATGNQYQSRRQVVERILRRSKG